MRPRKQFTLKFWNKLARHSGKYRLFKEGDAVLLAVSGGPDSVVMLDFFAHSCRRKQKLYICHLNHRIRGKKADADEAFVKKLGREYGIETFTKIVDVPGLAKSKKISVEHAARQARYDFFAKTALKLGCGLVATAHHADDNAETILLNLIRGTEPKGLLGIPVKRLLCAKGTKRIFVIRPMLAATRKEIMDYVRMNRLPYRKDESNEDEKYTRNWIRKILLPLIERKQPQFRAHLAETAYKLQKILIKDNR